MKKRSLVAICYDIQDEARRRKVAMILEGYGVRCQKSVFEARLDEASLEKLVRQVNRAIDKRHDALRVYRICSSCERKIWVVCGEPVAEEKSCEVVA